MQGGKVWPTACTLEPAMYSFQVPGMGLKNQVHRVDGELLMAKMADLQSSTRKLWPGQAHLYYEGYPVHPLNFRAL